jgi:hypothetical protein
MAAGTVMALAMTTPALTQGRLDARYQVTLGGVQIGKGAWVVDIADDQFTAAASGATAGLMRVFAKGQGTGAARGLVVAGTPVAATFAASITSDKKTEEIRMSIVGGTVKEVAISPLPPPSPDRIPVIEAHRRGVSDPMTSSLVRVPDKANLFGPDACPRKSVPVFDGRMRYDLQFAYKRVERVRAERGYEGPAVVCAIYFSPISGYVPTRYAIKYLIELRDMEAWLAPVAGTRVMVPFRVSIPTPLGVGVMQATQFVTASQPPRPANSRSQ